MILRGGDICPIKGEYKIVDYNGKLHGRAFADAGDTMPMLPEIWCTNIRKKNRINLRNYVAPFGVWRENKIKRPCTYLQRTDDKQ